MGMGLKKSESEDDHSALSSVEIKKTRIYTFTAPYVLCHGARLVTHRENFAFHFTVEYINKIA
jgi:hypothetical protein